MCILRYLVQRPRNTRIREIKGESPRNHRQESENMSEQYLSRELQVRGYNEPHLHRMSRQLSESHCGGFRTEERIDVPEESDSNNPVGFTSIVIALRGTGLQIEDRSNADRWVTADWSEVDLLRLDGPKLSTERNCDLDYVIASCEANRMSRRDSANRKRTYGIRKSQ